MKNVLFSVRSAVTAALAFGLSHAAFAGTDLTVYTAVEAEDLKKYAARFNEDHPDIKINGTTLEWGVPFYTKVRTSVAVGQGPDVMTYHLSRMPLGLSEGVLTPITAEDLATAPNLPTTPAAFCVVRTTNWSPVLKKPSSRIGEIVAPELIVAVFPPPVTCKRSLPAFGLPWTSTWKTDPESKVTFPLTVIVPIELPGARVPPEAIRKPLLEVKVPLPPSVPPLTTRLSIVLPVPLRKTFPETICPVSKARKLFE